MRILDSWRSRVVRVTDDHLRGPDVRMARLMTDNARNSSTEDQGLIDGRAGLRAGGRRYRPNDHRRIRARSAGVTLRALRFYQSKGLLAPERDGQARVYGQRRPRPAGAHPAGQAPRLHLERNPRNARRARPRLRRAAADQPQEMRRADQAARASAPRHRAGAGANCGRSTPACSRPFSTPAAHSGRRFPQVIPAFFPPLT